MGVMLTMQSELDGIAQQFRLMFSQTMKRALI